MKRRNLRKKLLAMLAAGAAVCSMGIMSPMAKETASADTMNSILTGEPVSTAIGRRRPISVMFNNIQAAIPQYGISKAGVVVEAEVEGLITRLMGIMEEYEDCGRIGSVRSARNYYYYFAREFNSIYCHFGEAAYALPLLRLDSTVELEGLSDYGEIAYYRSDDRPSPHNVFTDYDHIQAAIEYTGIDQNLYDSYTRHFLFADEGTETVLDNGIIANVVMPGYVYNHARFDYNAEDGLYYRSQYYDTQIDGDNGEALSCKNIILQYCESNPFDENNYLWTDVVTGGTGKFITNGRAIDITWSKPQPQEETTFIVNIESPYLSVPVYTGDFDITHYYDTDGNEIKLNRGQTWICVVRNSASNRVIITDNREISSDAIDYVE